MKDYNIGFFYRAVTRKCHTGLVFCYAFKSNPLKIVGQIGVNRGFKYVLKIIFDSLRFCFGNCQHMNNHKYKSLAFT